MNVKKSSKAIAILLTLIMVATMVPAMVSADENSGWDGAPATETPGQLEGVYQIGDAADLAWLAVNVNNGTEKSAKAELKADIDLNNKAWTAIGNTTNAFEGQFDGNDYKIINVNLTSSRTFQGIFGKTKGKIENIADVIGTASVTHNGTSSLIGWNDAGGIVKNCTSSVNLTIGNGANIAIGGIVGQNNGVVENCLFKGTMEINTGATGAKQVGGIVGKTMSGSEIRGCVNEGKISAEGIAGQYAGGVVGRIDNANCKVYNCYNAEDITLGAANTNTKVGGIAGHYTNNAFIFNCYNMGVLAGGELNGQITTAANANVSNNYSLDTATDLDSGQVSASDLDTEAFVTALNKDNNYGVTIDEACAYALGENFPIFRWQKDKIVSQVFQIASSTSEGGQITETQTVNYGADITFTAVADEGYIMSDLIVDEVSQGCEQNTYTFIDVRANHHIQAVFEKIQTPVEATVPAPTRMKATVHSYQSIVISWKKVDNADGYELYRSTSKTGKYNKVKTITNGKPLNVTDGKLTTGQTYFYRAKAYNKEDGKITYSKYSSIVSSKPLLKVPTAVKVKKAGKKSAKLSWKKVDGASGYTIYRAVKKTGKYKAVKAIKKASTVKYTNKKLKKNKKYYYKIRAYRMIKGKKVYGGYSKIVYIKTK